MLKDKKTIGIMAVLLIVILVSIFGGTKFAKPASGYKSTIESLDEKKSTVLKLTAAATASSVAVGAIPGDSTTAISEKLADVSSYFLIVLCAILFEKYFLSISGAAAFYILIPVACVLGILFLFFKKNILLKYAAKIALFGLTIALIIPTSVGVAGVIEKTYSSSIDETIDTASDTTAEIEKSTSDDADSEEDEGFLEGLTNKVTSSATTAFEKFEMVLSNFMEAVAVMLVTSCVVPVVVLLFLVWIIKLLLGVNIDVSVVSKKMMPKKHSRRLIEKE